MVNVHAPVVLKRNGFAKDRRTGMIYRITEIGGRDMMVKPAYKSDGVWVAPEHLQAVANPHTTSLKQVLAALGVLAVAAWVAYGVFDKLTGHGLSASDALWSGAFPSGATVAYLFGNLFGITRS